MALDLSGRFEFVRPDVLAPLDIPAHRATVTPQHQVKGMFFQGVLALLPEKQHPDRRYLVFRSYPLLEYFDLVVAALAHTQSRRPPRQTLNELGRQSYPTFANSMVGRVVLGVLGDDLDSIMQRAARAYGVAVDGPTITSHQLAPGHWRLGFEATPNFIDSYHVGVLEGAILHCRKVPDVKVRMLSVDSAVVDVRWTNA